MTRIDLDCDLFVLLHVRINAEFSLAQLVRRSTKRDMFVVVGAPGCMSLCVFGDFLGTLENARNFISSWFLEIHDFVIHSTIMQK